MLRQPMCLCCLLVEPLDRQGRTALELTALNDNPHKDAALLVASSRACCCLGAKGSTALELATYGGSVGGIMTLTQRCIRFI